MNRLTTKIIISITILLIMSACSVSRKGTIAITKPIRTIEDMTSGQDQVINTEQLPNVIAISKFSNSTSEPDAPKILRAVLQSHLSNKNFKLIHYKEVDLKNQNGDLASVQLADSLGADAVLTGTVTDYESFYAGIYAHIKLGVSLELISKDGDRLWHIDKVITSRAGGVSTSPWGLLLNAALAALHLEDKNLFAAADELGREISKSMPEPEGYKGSSLPSIEMVVHDGSDKWFKYGDVISLGIKGDSGNRGIIEIENIGSFDLVETEPGIYTAKINVDKRWQGIERVITGKLIDSKGQIARSISPMGLVNFDNQKPSNINNFKADFATQQKIQLSWDNPLENDLIYEVSISSANINKTVISVSSEPTLSIDGPFTLFETFKISIVAIDKAKNKSFVSEIDITAYPIKLTDIENLDSQLKGSYSGTHVLSREHSPYVLTEHTRFMPNSTVIIEPGVKIKFRKTGLLEINGNAYFWGDLNNIEFSNESNKSPAKKFLMLNSTSTVEIDGLSIVKPGIGVDIQTGTPVLKNIKSMNAKYSAINISGNANVSINNCLLVGSSTSAIVLSGRSRLKINKCTMQKNKPFHIQNSSSFAVKATDITFDKSAARAVLGKIEE